MSLGGPDPTSVAFSHKVVAVENVFLNRKERPNGLETLLQGEDLLLSLLTQFSARKSFFLFLLLHEEYSDHMQHQK